MPQHEINKEVVHVKVKNAGQSHAAYTERIDYENGYARRAWQEMHEPDYLSCRQVQQLESASSLRKRTLPFNYASRVLSLELGLPPHSVAAITIEM